MAFSYSEVNYSLPPIRYLSGSRTSSFDSLPQAIVSNEAVIGRTSVQYGPIVSVAQDLSGAFSTGCFRRAPSTEALVAIEQPRARLAAPQPARLIRTASQEAVIADPRLVAQPALGSSGSVMTTSNEHLHQTVKLINDGTGLKTEITNHITKVNDIHHYRVEHVRGETREFNDFKETRTVEPAKCLRA